MFVSGAVSHQAGVIEALLHRWQHDQHSWLMARLRHSEQALSHLAAFLAEGVDTIVGFPRAAMHNGGGPMRRQEEDDLGTAAPFPLVLCAQAAIALHTARRSVLQRGVKLSQPCSLAVLAARDRIMLTCLQGPRPAKTPTRQRIRVLKVLRRLAGCADPPALAAPSVYSLAAGRFCCCCCCCSNLLGRS